MKTVKLTTKHASSSYGIPVLLIDGVAYGALDKIPNGEIAYFFVESNKEKLGADNSEKFLKSAPDLYFK